MFFNSKKSFLILALAIFFFSFYEKNCVVFCSDAYEDPFMDAVRQNCAEAFLRSPLTVKEKVLPKEKALHKKASKKTNLFDLIENGSFEEIHNYLKSGGRVDKKNASGITVLFSAIRLGRDDVFDLLIKKGANIYSCSNIKSVTPLHCAAYYGRTSILKYLIAKYDYIDLPSRDGFSPLMYAIRFGGQEVVDCLINAGANVNWKVNFNMHSPLHYAVAFGDVTIIEKLLIAGADLYAKDFDGNSALHWAAINKNKNNFIFLLNYYDGCLPRNDKMQVPADLF